MFERFQRMVLQYGAYRAGAAQANMEPYKGPSKDSSLLCRAPLQGPVSSACIAVGVAGQCTRLDTEA